MTEKLELIKKRYEEIEKSLSDRTFFMDPAARPGFQKNKRS